MTCFYCNVSKTINSCSICVECRPRYEKSTQKLCLLCKQLKSWEDFYSKKGTLFGIDNKCKTCASIEAEKHSRKFDTFFNKMLHTCRWNWCANKANAKADFLLTIEQLKEKWIIQNGKCAYSGTDMNFGTHCNFKASPERLDTNKSYTNENVVLIIAELNIGQGKQFSTRLLIEICTPDRIFHPQIDEINATTTSQKQPRVLTKKKVETMIAEIDKVLLRKCIDCSIYKIIEEFRIAKENYPNRRCRSCDKLKTSVDAATVEGKLKRLLRAANNHTKKRNSIPTRMKTTLELTIEEMKSQLIQQQGKCYYSGKNLSFDGKKAFHISLERMNTKLGYTKDNCVFICEELNAPDHSSQTALHNLEKRGHQGWTKDKFVAFRNHVNNTIIET